MPEIVLTDSERQPCEVWTRVMGYHRPTSSFNIGKLAEFRERVFYNEDMALDSVYRGCLPAFPDCALGD